MRLRFIGITTDYQAGLKVLEETSGLAKEGACQLETRFKLMRNSLNQDMGVKDLGGYMEISRVR